MEFRMNEPAHIRTEGITDATLRAELADVAFDLFQREGLEKVTVDRLAAAAGVSRTTFLHHFATKEEAVLSVFCGHFEPVAAALRARPAREDDWTALRRSFDPVITALTLDGRRTLAALRMIRENSTLRAWWAEKRQGWSRAMIGVLAERSDLVGSALAAAVMTAAALICLDVALNHWCTCDGRPDLTELVYDAFVVLASV
jgi:AcrR family transcriptional regulator